MFLVSCLDHAAALLDVPGLNWKYILYGGLTFQALFSSWLDLRQFKTLRAGYNKLPPTISGLVDSETYDKSREYSRTKLSFGIFSRVIHLTVNFGVYYADVLPMGWQLAQRFVGQYLPWGASGTIVPSIVLWTLMTTFSSVLEIPFDWYKNFVIEEKFGFNKMTRKTFITDNIKSYILSFVLSPPLLAAVLFIIDRFGRAFVGYLLLLMTTVTVVMSVVYPSLIAPLFNTFTPLEDEKLYAAIEELASKLHFPMSRIYVVDGSKRSSHSNAYFTGLPFLPKRIVLFDSLLETHSHDEILAIMAHEMGHWSRNHTPMLLLYGQIQLAVYGGLISVLLGNQSLAKSLHFTGPLPTIIAIMVFEDFSTPVLNIIQVITMRFSRYCEYDADRFAVEQGYGPALSAGLIALSKKNLSVYIADRLYSGFHYSHPILHERLSAIQATEDALERKSK